MGEIRIDTPESVDITFVPAGLGSRFLAALVDGGIQWGAGLLLLLTAGLVSLLGRRLGQGTGAAAVVNVYAILGLVGALLVGIYKLLLETFWNGQTLGKRVAGIRVVQRNGLPVRFWQVLVRNLLRVIDFLPALYGLGALLILVTGNSQRLGDLIAGTVVVRVRPAAAPVLPQRVAAAPVVDLAALRELVLRLSDAQLDAARGFWQRRDALEPQARRRLAEHLTATLVAELGWQGPLPEAPEAFIEAVLYARAH